MERGRSSHGGRFSLFARGNFGVEESGRFEVGGMNVSRRGPWRF